jgi:ribosome-associated heat shock protein Hsp15
LTDTENKAGKVRVDKWLWAARFFKTRSLAKTAIEGGKVQMDGQRVKVSREVAPGDVLRVRQGWDEHEVVVSAVTDQRRGAPIAQTLYEETPAECDAPSAGCRSKKSGRSNA